MGVQNLWLLLAPSAQKVPESHLSSQRVAIDISIWVIHILHGSIRLGSSHFDNIHLLAIFKRLLRLLALGVKPVFVFDGKVPELKKCTVAARAGVRRVNMKKIAEKLIVKQLEGKKLSNLLVKREEDSDNEAIELEEEGEEQVKDLMQLFEEEIEREGVRDLLERNGYTLAEYELMDYSSQRDLLRGLKQKALEEQQNKLKSIESKVEFSKLQMQEYLKEVERKKGIEQRKKELGEQLNLEVIEENRQKIQEVGGLLQGAKVEVVKEFLVVRKEKDPELERLRNLMGKVQKPQRKYKRDKLKECDEKLSKLLESRGKSQKKEQVRREEENEKEEENNELGIKGVEKKIKIEEIVHNQSITNDKTNQNQSETTRKVSETKEEDDSNILRMINKDKQKNEEKEENINDELYKTQNKSVETFNKGPEGTKTEIFFEEPLPKSQKQLAVPVLSPELSKLDSLRKAFHEEEVRKMVSSHTSRSSSKSSRKPNDSLGKKSLTREEILHEIEKMETIQTDINEEMTIDHEMTDDFIRLSNLNALNASMSTKFEQIKGLLQLFGVPWVESPFEAEAQCAYLELCGLVDGIITEDSDVFLFGGRKVYRKVFSGTGSAELYDMGTIERDLGLNREKMISLALFLGSDYTLGVKGVGIVNAMEIVNAFETIDSLERFKVWAEKPDVLLEDSDSFYRNIPLKELQYKYFHKNYKKNWEFPDLFPDLSAVEAYQQPGVDDSLEPFIWNEPDIEGLKDFLARELEWGKERIDEAGLELGKIVKKMRENKGQKKIEDYYHKNPVAIVKSKRLQAAIKSMRPEDEEKEQEIKREIDFLEDLNSFGYKKKKNE